MDPYLERYWDDVHACLCTGISSNLQPQLRSHGLRARVTEDVRLLDEVGDSPGAAEPNMVMVELESATLPLAGGDTLQPIFVRQLPSLRTARWVEVIDVNNDSRVVTAIVVLSPYNKAFGDLNHAYRTWLRRRVNAGANVVEIDLLRSSREELAVPMHILPRERRAAYCTCVKRVADPDLWAAYPMPLRDPLPTIPVPCREREPDVSLPLQPIIDRIYEEGAYDSIDYTVPPRPPLSAADAAWAAELIAKRPTNGN